MQWPEHRGACYSVLNSPRAERSEPALANHGPAPMSSRKTPRKLLGEVATVASPCSIYTTGRTPPSDSSRKARNVTGCAVPAGAASGSGFDVVTVPEATHVAGSAPVLPALGRNVRRIGITAEGR